MRTIKEEEDLEAKDSPYVTTIEDVNRQIEETPTFKLAHKDQIDSPEDHLEGVHASYDVQCNQVVPTDRSEYVQAMYNPLTAGDNPELITVQVVYPRLREYSDALA